MTKHSARKLRVAYNNTHRKILKLHMRCSASQMFAGDNLLNFEALMRKMSNTCINPLISSDNAIIKVFLDGVNTFTVFTCLILRIIAHCFAEKYSGY